MTIWHLDAVLLAAMILLGAHRPFVGWWRGNSWARRLTPIWRAVGVSIGAGLALTLVGFSWLGWFEHYL